MSDAVPVFDVTAKNFDSMWPSIDSSIRCADVVALDMELSGLGQRDKLQLRSIEERYLSLRDVCQSRGVISIGLATFCMSSTHCYNVAVYNLMLLSTCEYTVEPSSLQFLLEHGFDFNKQYRDGIRYKPFKDDYKPSSFPPSHPSASFESLFSSLVCSRKPVVFHNGLIDLAFLYQHFYAPLPPKLDTFLADLSDIFPVGIFDTKYVAEFCSRDEASYLHYIFRKRQRRNSECRMKGEKHVEVVFDAATSNSDSVDWVCCSLPTQSDVSTVNVCQQYAVRKLKPIVLAGCISQYIKNHGYCSAGSACPSSHNIDVILNQQETIRQAKEAARKRRKRKRKSKGKTDDQNSDPPGVIQEISKSNGKSVSDNQELHDGQKGTLLSSGHRAGFDAKGKTDDQNSDPPGLIQEISKSNGKSISDNQELNDGQKGTLLSGGHRAGFDAFMAGFCFVFMAEMERGEGLVSWNEGLADWRNRLSLSGKPMPLIVAKSHFSKPSVYHMQRLAALTNTT